MAILHDGGTAPLETHRVRATLSWTEQGGAHDIDLSALVLTTTDRVSDDGDLIFYNQRSHPSGAVAHEGREGASDRIRIETTALPESAGAVVLAASVSGETFGSVQGLALVIADLDSGTEYLRLEVPATFGEDARVIGRIRRHDGRWEFIAGGPSWDSGLAGLIVHFGVNIGGPAEEVAAAPGSDSEPEEPPVAPVLEHPVAESVPALEPFAGTSGAHDTPGDTVWSLGADSPGAGDSPVQDLPSPTPHLTDSFDQSSPASTERAADVPLNENGSAPTTPRPEVVEIEPLPRLRIARSSPQGATTFDSAPLTLPLDQAIQFTRAGEEATTHFWLRVTCTAGDLTSAVDVGALTYDEVGQVCDVVDDQSPGAGGGAVGLVTRPVSTDPDATAAVELRLDALDPATRGIIVAATSYTGAELSTVASIITDLVDEAGTILVRTECPGTRSSAALLVSLTRDDNGLWFLTALGHPAAGRSVRSLVGAGYWALIA